MSDKVRSWRLGMSDGTDGGDVANEPQAVQEERPFTETALMGGLFGGLSAGRRMIANGRITGKGGGVLLREHILGQIFRQDSARDRSAIWHLKVMMTEYYSN